MNAIKTFKKNTIPSDLLVRTIIIFAEKYRNTKGDSALIKLKQVPNRNKPLLIDLQYFNKYLNAETRLLNVIKYHLTFLSHYKSKRYYFVSKK